MQPMLRSDVFKINGVHVEEEGSKWRGFCECRMQREHTLASISFHSHASSKWL